MAKLTKASVKIAKRNPWINPVLFIAGTVSLVGLVVPSLAWVTLLFLAYVVYYYYWLYKTKVEMNALGANIPTFILIFIPLINIYWIYKYAKGFVSVIKKKGSPWLWFAFIFFIGPIAAFFIQKELNRFGR